MSKTHVRVRAGAEQYALGVHDVLEVDELGALTPVPGAPAAVLGVHNLRGHIVPVIDLAAVLATSAADPPARVVVIERGESRAALAVDQVLGVERMPDPTETVQSPHLAGAAIVDGTLVGFLDVDSILSTVTESVPR